MMMFVKGQGPARLGLRGVDHSARRANDGPMADVRGERSDDGR